MYLKAYTLTLFPSKFKNFICLLDLKLGQHVASLFRVVINHSHECRKTSTSQQCGNDNHNNRNVDESRITMINNFKASTTEMCTNIYLMQFTKLSGIVLFAFLLPFNVMPNNIYSFHVIITQYQFDILMYMWRIFRLSASLLQKCITGSSSNKVCSKYYISNKILLITGCLEQQDIALHATRLFPLSKWWWGRVQMYII